jgi:broad-specificity NMP kinase
VVSGVVDAVHAVHGEEIPDGAVTMCRLCASPEEIERRLAMRGEPPEVVAEALRAADMLESGDVADLAVDTTGRSVAAVASQVCALVRPATPVPAPELASGDGRVLWVHEPTGVGKSTVGFRLCQEILRCGWTAAFVTHGSSGSARER